MPELRKARFTWDDVDSFEGYTFDQTWNGFACPYFTREEGDAVLYYCIASGDEGHYDQQEDTFMVTYPPEAGGETDSFPGIDVEVDGKPMHLYPIGAWHWCWSEVS